MSRLHRSTPKFFDSTTHKSTPTTPQVDSTTLRFHDSEVDSNKTHDSTPWLVSWLHDFTSRLHNSSIPRLISQLHDSWVDSATHNSTPRLIGRLHTSTPWLMIRLHDSTSRLHDSWFESTSRLHDSWFDSNDSTSRLHVSWVRIYNDYWRVNELLLITRAKYTTCEVRILLMSRGVVESTCGVVESSQKSGWLNFGCGVVESILVESWTRGVPNFAIGRYDDICYKLWRLGVCRVQLGFDIASNSTGFHIGHPVLEACETCSIHILTKTIHFRYETSFKKKFSCKYFFLPNDHFRFDFDTIQKKKKNSNNKSNFSRI